MVPSLFGGVSCLNNQPVVFQARGNLSATSAGGSVQKASEQALEMDVDGAAINNIGRDQRGLGRKKLKLKLKLKLWMS